MIKFILLNCESALSFGVKTGYLTFNVGAVVKLPKLENTLTERIMSEQLLAKMFALETNPRNHAILILLYRAGLRAAELCSLTWTKLQARDEGGQVAVFGKGKKTRFVLIDQPTWDEVRSLRTPGQMAESYVFQSRQTRSRAGKVGRRMDESMIHRIVHAAAARAGITANVSPHWMRHAHATIAWKEARRSRWSRISWGIAASRRRPSIRMSGQTPVQGNT